MRATLPALTLAPRRIYGRTARARFQSWHYPIGVRRLIAAGITCSLLALATIIVYATGGTHLAYAHIAYIPVILGAFFFGFRGGVLTALAAGLLLGPYMPLNVDAGTYQTTINWLSRTAFFAMTGGLAGLLCAALRRQLELVRRQAYFDRLTGLPNRLSCLQDLENAIAAGAGAQTSFAVVKLGIARFEHFAATLGHHHADELLKVAADRLEERCSSSCKLYDVGGGVFAAIIPTASPGEAVELGNHLLLAFDEPFTIAGIPVLAGGHVGIACHPDHAGDARRLLRAAAAGFRDAVDTGRSYAIYEEQHNLTHRSAMMILADLHTAISNREMTLHYQPKLDMRSGACTGVEALARWRHPVRGFISPAEFIPIAEQTALIRPLTDLVLRTALRQAADWRQCGLTLSVAVNVSIRNLEDESFALRLAGMLAAYDVDPSALEVEVTETAFMMAKNNVVDVLHSLRQLGVRVALDDFGVGQSSLAYLRNLPADVLKLDRTFIRNLCGDAKDAAIVEAMVETGHKLDLQVVAEGIEDRQAYERLSSMSCDLGQGYFIAPPLSKADFEAWHGAHQSLGGAAGPATASASIS